MDRAQRRSAFQLTGLPEQFGIVLLSVALVLLLSPYLAGADFGVLRVPEFPASTERALKLLGPPLFVVIVALFVPVWKGRPVAVAASPDTGSTEAPGGLKLTVTSTRHARESLSPFLESALKKSLAKPLIIDDLGTVLGELVQNAFEHGGASSVVIGIYREAIVVQDNGLHFNPLQRPTPRDTTKGAGLFVLRDYLTHLEPAVLVEYERFKVPADEKPPHSHPSNELVLHGRSADRQADDRPAWVRLRRPVDDEELVPWNFSHLFELSWGSARHLFEYDKTEGMIRAAARASVSRDLVSMVMRRLPPGATLHLRIARDSAFRRYLKDVQPEYEKSFPGKTLSID